MNEQDDGYEPTGHWVADGSGWMSLVPASPPSVDLLDKVTQQTGPWLLHGTVFSDGKKAALLAGQLKVFYRGVRLVKQKDKYFILYWFKKGND